MNESLSEILEAFPTQQDGLKALVCKDLEDGTDTQIISEETCKTILQALKTVHYDIMYGYFY